jgi:hypothetical protein
MQITIGRNSTNQIILDHQTISSHHAVIELEGENIILKDLNSSNGTFVNGQPILKKKINLDDKVKFGLYELDNELIKTKLKDLIKETKTDYSIEFNQLEKIFKDYKKETNAIDKNLNFKKIALRILITVVLMGISFLFFQNPVSTIFVGIISGGLVSIFINSGNIKDKKDEIQLKYSFTYKCPKCDSDLTKHAWQYWKKKGQCNNNNCNAHWN